MSSAAHSTACFAVTLSPVFLYLIFSWAWYHLRAHAIRRTTCIEELKSLGQPSQRKGKEKRTITGTAIVCGGGLGGLLTARVCHDHFDRVIIIEPEEWVSTEQGKLVQPWKQTQKRKRVVQYDSILANHVFTLKAWEKMFPDFAAECKKSDVRIIPADIKAIMLGRGPFRFPFEMYNGTLPAAVSASRQGLETLVRRLVLDKERYPRIEQIVGTVTGIQRDPSDAQKIEKVLVRSIDGERELDARLVIDCTGAAQNGYRWLKDAGYGSLDSKFALPIDHLKITYDPKMHYSNFQLVIHPELAKRMPDIVPGYNDDTGPILCVFCAKDPKHSYAWRRDGDIIQITAGRWGDGPMPTTMDEMIEFTRQMEVAVPLPEWYFRLLEVLKDEAKEFFPVDKVRCVPSRLIQYHKAVNLACNFVALGDAVSRITPIGGHGVSKMMMGVCVLDYSLRSLKSNNIPATFAQHFFKAQFDKISQIWEIVKIGDYARPSTVPHAGETLDKGAWARWYNGKILALRLMDAEVGSVGFHVGNYIAPKLDLFHPRIVLKVLWLTLQQKLS